MGEEQVEGTEIGEEDSIEIDVAALQFNQSRLPNRVAEIFRELDEDSKSPGAVTQSRTDLLLAKIVLELRDLQLVLRVKADELRAEQYLLAEQLRRADKEEEIPFPNALG